MNDIIQQPPVEVKTESNVYLSIQLSETTITDVSGEKKVCPEIVLLCQRQKNSQKYIPIQFSVEQVHELIHHLETMRDKAILYENNIKIH